MRGVLPHLHPGRGDVRIDLAVEVWVLFGGASFNLVDLLVRTISWAGCIALWFILVNQVFSKNFPDLIYIIFNEYINGCRQCGAL
jgi:hypothetical protein